MSTLHLTLDRVHIAQYCKNPQMEHIRTVHARGYPWVSAVHCTGWGTNSSVPRVASDISMFIG
eukprot:3256445-Rhodomonas_salina.1